ncbi:hypothetical protein AHF37_04131 [Paragonimus kellicotti]|nr:hypothetical protein AHF37_04131 [Paragonimus kellicotti]
MLGTPSPQRPYPAPVTAYSFVPTSSYYNSGTNTGNSSVSYAVGDGGTNMAFADILQESESSNLFMSSAIQSAFNFQVERTTDQSIRVQTPSKPSELGHLFSRDKPSEQEEATYRLRGDRHSAATSTPAAAVLLPVQQCPSRTLEDRSDPHHMSGSHPFINTGSSLDNLNDPHDYALDVKRFDRVEQTADSAYQQVCVFDTTPSIRFELYGYEY